MWSTILENVKFYIGMSEQYRSHFDKPDTLGDKLIRGQWDKHSEDIYQILAVLAVVTEKTFTVTTFPQTIHPDLKKDIIKHFKDEKYRPLKTTRTAQ